MKRSVPIVYSIFSFAFVFAITLSSCNNIEPPITSSKDSVITTDSITPTINSARSPGYISFAGDSIVATLEFDNIANFLPNNQFDSMGVAITNYETGPFGESQTINGLQVGGKGNGVDTVFLRSLYNPPFAIWSIKGYANRNFSDTIAIPGKMFPLNLHGGDTVSRSQGFTMTYSGSSGGDLVGNLSFSRAASGPDSAAIMDGTGVYAAAVRHGDDNGTITFTPLDLASFKPGSYMKASVKHWLLHYHRITNGDFLCFVSQTFTAVELYVKP